ncbi:isoprenyl transferase [Gracilibacillus marinus]|uniref:Isoprenyl transferase n=1 Tax=Gracilibacillus marinus TaxID=630535 RepID=A0ABV8VTW0_9BACI
MMLKKIPFLNNKKVYTEDDFTLDHIAMIMDGNGRWARKRGLPRVAGHKEGISTVMKVVRAASSRNVKYLTLYAFSTENWKRPKAEVDFILKLPKEFLHVFLPELIENNVRVQAIGDVNNLPAHTREAMAYAIERTKDNTGLQLNFALNYGSRSELLHAMKEVVSDIKEGKLAQEDLTEEHIASYLYTADIPEPDLLIRTGGEKRLSNFLLWQLAYTEFLFTDVLWPDFNEEEFLRAIEEYQQRHRRYGGL